MMSLKVWFLLVSSSTILMFVTLFFLFPSSTNKHMTDVDVTPPSPNACSYLPALLNGSPTFVTSNISFASSSWVMFPATLAASSVLASTQSHFLSLVPVYLVLPVTRRKKSKTYQIKTQPILSSFFTMGGVQKCSWTFFVPFYTRAYFSQ